MDQLMCQRSQPVTRSPRLEAPVWRFQEIAPCFQKAHGDPTARQVGEGCELEGWKRWWKVPAGKPRTVHFFKATGVAGFRGVSSWWKLRNLNGCFAGMVFWCFFLVPSLKLTKQNTWTSKIDGVGSDDFILFGKLGLFSGMLDSHC